MRLQGTRETGMDTIGTIIIGDMVIMVMAGTGIAAGGATGDGDLAGGLGSRRDYSGHYGATIRGDLTGDGVGGIKCIPTVPTSW